MAEHGDDFEWKFITPRLRVFIVASQEAVQLCRTLLENAEVAARVPWIREKTGKAFEQEMLRFELLCAAGALCVWAVERIEDGAFVAAIVDNPSAQGSNLELIVRRECWGLGYGDEAMEPLLRWLR
ncbi:hypothetical protein [Trinickia sp. Y13]|uniref:hypothetical protein n=1 Tax=Trinickia sp. Y13 TaxID=2917807 RepID=UPI0024074913|nr:hypothetical protein [Trinickia sp. Y13]MDG0025502.1 hypothetical protein [Trinickia sp. Y13]